jgi:hypothetical protein
MSVIRYPRVSGAAVTWGFLAFARGMGRVTAARRRMVVSALVAAALCCVMPAAAATTEAASGGSWHNARVVPGLGLLNAGGHAEVASVSCASAGNCAAGGYYLDGSDHIQAFVVSERDGSWGAAIKVPGSAALNAGGIMEVSSVSCGSAGDCAAGGYYTDGSGHAQAFVVSERDGSWGTAIEVPGSAALNAGGLALLNSVSCGAMGNCAAGGSYWDSSGHSQAFVVNERNGSWGTAIEVPGSAALNAGGNAGVASVSCTSAGNCAAGGSYTDGSRHVQAFVVSEQDGYWATAQELPGSAALNTGGIAAVESVSCASAGNCAASGSYLDSSGHPQAFVASEQNGSWHNAIEVPGFGALNAGGNIDNSLTVSCGSVGNCAVGGQYTDGSGNRQGFLANERDGSWQHAFEVPGLGLLNAGGNASLISLSCASAGNCAGGGFYADSSSGIQAFVVNETGGTWHRAIEVPGSGALNVSGDAGVFAVSCTRTGSCAAGGRYQASGALEGFVVNGTLTG